MRGLTPELLDNVTDALGLPSSQVVEKDFRVVEVLSAVTAAALPPGVRLVFAGGTCLARAHGLVRRMSEDIDLKVVVPPLASKSALRTMLSRTKAAVHAAIVGAGFPKPTVTAKNDNKNDTPKPAPEGLDFVRRIIEAGPKRVVYVTCNPTTFAPNAAQLAEAGYALKRVRPVDMFPQTPHIECVALLDRAA